MSLESEFLNDLRLLDSDALAVYNEVGSKEAIELVTSWGVNAGDAVTKNWKDFFGELFVRFRDGYDIQTSTESSLGFTVGQKGYSQPFYKRIVEETGDKYLEKRTATNDETTLKKTKSAKNDLEPVSKLNLKQV